MKRAHIIPITVIEVLDLLISGREKLAKELVTELQEFEIKKKRSNRVK